MALPPQEQERSRRGHGNEENPPDVGDGVKCFRTDNGTEFVNETFARVCSDEKNRHEHTGVDGPKHNGVVQSGLGLIPEIGMPACLEAPRLFSGASQTLTAIEWKRSCTFRRPRQTPTSSRRTRYIWGNYRRPTPLPSCSRGSSAYNAPPNRSQRPRGCSTSTGGDTTRGTA